MTYGMTCSPFLAIRSLFQLADDAKSEFSETAEIIKRDFYVNDIITKADTIKDDIKLHDDSINVARKGGFLLRKWPSNEPKMTHRRLYVYSGMR